MDDDITATASHCPTCGMEYRTGFDTCADDGTALVAGPAPVHGEPDSGSPHAAAPGDAWAEANERFKDGWAASDAESSAEAADDHPEPAVLCRLPSEEAVLLAGALEAAGIESMAAGQGYGIPLQPHLARVPELSGFEDVLVPADRLEEAREIARELLEDSEA